MDAADWANVGVDLVRALAWPTLAAAVLFTFRRHLADMLAILIERVADPGQAAQFRVAGRRPARVTTDLHAAYPRVDPLDHRPPGGAPTTQYLNSYTELSHTGSSSATNRCTASEELVVRPPEHGKQHHVRRVLEFVEWRAGALVEVTAAYGAPEPSVPGRSPLPPSVDGP